jgi:uncharacterized membrane protein
MELTALVDKSIPGEGGTFDHATAASVAALERAAERPGVGLAVTALRGNEWLGHPIHPVVIALPIGAWVVSAWYDARSAATGDERDEHAADGALRLGIAGAVVSAVTGVVQYIDTRGAVRRETALHAALNNVALGLYVSSAVLRRRGNRPLARRLSYAGLGVVGLSGYLGGDLAFRHGVGVRPQAWEAPVVRS